MKLSELHREPGFWPWVKSLAAAIGIVLTFWAAYDKLNAKVFVPIQQQKAAAAKDRADRKARSLEISADLDSILADVRFLKRRATGRR